LVVVPILLFKVLIEGRQYLFLEDKKYLSLYLDRCKKGAKNSTLIKKFKKFLKAAKATAG